MHSIPHMVHDKCLRIGIYFVKERLVFVSVKGHRWRSWSTVSEVSPDLLEIPADIAQFIPKIYSAIDGFQGDGRLQHEMMLTLGCVACSIHSWSPLTGKAIVHQMTLRDHEPGSDALGQILADYNENHVSLNPLPLIGHRKGLLQEGAVLARQDLISDEEWQDSDFFRSVAHYTPEVTTFSIVIRNQPKTIVIANFSTDQDSSVELERLRQRLKLVAPHMVRVFAAIERLYDLEVGFRASISAMDRLGFGIVTIARDRSIIVANSVAKMHLSDADGLLVRDDQIYHVDPVIDRSLQENITLAIERSKEGDDCKNPLRELRLGNGLHSKVTLVTYALPSPEVRMGDRTPVCMLLIHDVDLELTKHKELFSLLYDLTPNETEVALSIAKGLSPEETSEKLGHAVATTRTVLKRVYSKTNTKRQNELTYLVLSHKDLISD